MSSGKFIYASLKRCILNSVANFFVGHMVFVGNVQKSPIASHLKGLDPSLVSAVKVQLSQA